MKNKLYLLLILLLTIIISFPSICFSELKTVEHERCDVYLGNLKDRKELEQFRKYLKEVTIVEGIFMSDKSIKDNLLLPNDDIIKISQYPEKVIVIRHREEGRNVCDKVKITFDPEVIRKYIRLNIQTIWENDIDNVLTKKSEKINIGIIIETKIPDLDVSKREQLENEDEKQFFNMIERNKNKYKVIDRRHLGKVLEEQKLSSSGITDSETVKLGKLLNLDIIVLRLIYENSRVTKVLKVDTGEVLLFKTYETEKKTDDGWVLEEDKLDCTPAVRQIGLGQLARVYGL